MGAVDKKNVCKDKVFRKERSRIGDQLGIERPGGACRAGLLVRGF